MSDPRRVAPAESSFGFGELPAARSSPPVGSYGGVDEEIGEKTRAGPVDESDDGTLLRGTRPVETSDFGGAANSIL
ncbi:hypothetical protein IEQ34_014031 [Dendrobium chrysotoxum]|uniref:Uncharacterized protein n=1 Tax=Dendrobium chrysotoxum TaxID=161865 RepID=A0AAV7GKD0_DENCH|nr:hypothetical protein IEQ34_014031 [Dendrobium chrysotoxum]